LLLQGTFDGETVLTVGFEVREFVQFAKGKEVDDIVDGYA
jgi:hypothetical protein